MVKPTALADSKQCHYANFQVGLVYWLQLVQACSFGGIEFGLPGACTPPASPAPLHNLMPRSVHRAFPVHSLLPRYTVRKRQETLGLGGVIDMYTVLSQAQGTALLEHGVVWCHIPFHALHGQE